MAKRKKKPLVISQMRIGLVDTNHGQFYRLMLIETTDGEITDSQFLHNYFSDPSDIHHVIHGATAALQLPVITVSLIEKKH